MRTTNPPLIIIIFIAIAVVLFFISRLNSFDIPKGETLPFIQESKNENVLTGSSEYIDSTEDSAREQFITDDVRHSIPLDEIRQGCLGRDCIPSVDSPEFVDINEAVKLFRTEGYKPEDVIGISLTFNGENRFYPFNMLVTREIVNDKVAGQPVVVTYCPLCGTGIVFNRVYDGEILEFGVSGLLWQSNLLMYNRNENEDEVSLWSQVLGEAVLGNRTGDKLTVLPSDVIDFSNWAKLHPEGEVLNTGRMGDPYNGDYYSVASSFNPSFNEEESTLSPTAYVFGVEVNGAYKAYENDSLQVGATKDEVNGVELRIEKSEEGVVRFYGVGIKEPLPVVTGFWFSWKAAHPDTELFSN